MDHFLIFAGAALFLVVAAVLTASVFFDVSPVGYYPLRMAALTSPSPRLSASLVTSSATPLPPNNPPAIEVVATNLNIPWALAWLPDQTLLFTERPGRLTILGANQKIIPVANVAPVGEGGLLGLAIHPDFNANQYLYLYYTLQAGAGLTNQVDRYRLVNASLLDRQTIIEGIPGSKFHDGGRLAFGPDRKLYVTTGDAGDEKAAQDPNSLAGKILRLNDDGSIPTDNPFGNAVYSLGHRNPQGLAWDNDGRLWSTEHGRSGINSGYDEINLIERGQNYGWPEIQGDETKAGLVAPKAHSGPTTTWAPASAAFLNGSLYFGGLRGEALYQVRLTGENLTGPVVAKLKNQYGRIRDVAVGPDGWLYLTTSNTDGRGNPKSGDDKIIRFNPGNL